MKFTNSVTASKQQSAQIPGHISNIDRCSECVTKVLIYSLICYSYKAICDYSRFSPINPVHAGSTKNKIKALMMRAVTLVLCEAFPECFCLMMENEPDWDQLSGVLCCLTPEYMHLISPSSCSSFIQLTAKWSGFLVLIITHTLL